MKKELKKKQGISLIVLVITIIIMIILATAVILSLSSSNIVDKANTATQRSDFSNAKSVAATAYGESMLEGLTGDEEIAYVQEKLDASFGAGKYIAGEKGQVAPVPAGFTASIYEGENTVEDGLVIYETNALAADTEGNTANRDYAQTHYNQFVWVPVENGWQVGRDWGKGTVSLLGIEFGTAPSPKITESINTYGGFYIARYEAGIPSGGTYNIIDGTQRPVSIKSTAVWNVIPCDSTWSLGVTFGDSTKPGCGLVANKAYESSSSVLSHLIYGAEWDAALNFISKKDSNYVTESTGKGNYTRTIAHTGSNSSYAVNNIYDMAGNVEEWTMEACTFNGNGVRVLRGGSYENNGNERPASFRSRYYPNGSGGNAGFRVVLCLK